jgi:hypothetical protein
MGSRTLLGVFFSAILVVGVASNPMYGAEILVSTQGNSIATAIANAADGDTITVDIDGPIEEVLNIGGITGLTIEAGAGNNPVLLGDSTMDDAKDFDSQPFGHGGRLVNLDTGVTFRGITFRIDLSGLEPVQDVDPDGIQDPVARGFQVMRIASGANGATAFENCNFEFSGTAGTDPLILGRDMVRVEGASDVTISGCEFRYRDMTPTPWPVFNNTLVYFIPGEGGTLNLDITNCNFDAVADMVPEGARARSLGNGNGDAGNAVVLIENCRFGLNRRHTRQYQQAWIYPGGNTDLTVRGCDFPNGAGRYYGGGVGMNALIEGCTFRQTWGAEGSVLLPDPAAADAGTRVTCVNCAFSFVSNNGGDNSLARSQDAAGSDQGRGFTFRNCTFNDLSGTRAEGFVDFGGGQTATGIVNANNLSPEMEFTNCIFNIPGWTRHIIKNLDAPGVAPEGGVVGSGNLINSKAFPLVDGILPMGAFAVSNQDPLLAEDGIHLLAGSPAINAGAGGDSTDIDGDGLVGDRDIGADERGGADDTDPRRTITFPGDADSLNQALALANGNGDIIEITSDGPFFGRIRTQFGNGMRVSSKLHIRAGDGVNPIFIVDADEDFLTEEVIPDGQNVASCGCFAVCFDFNQSVTLSGLHFRMDITDADIVDLTNPSGSSRILMKTQGREMEAIFNDCIFEIRGNVANGFEIAYGGRQTNRHEGNTRNVHNRCEWRWDQELYVFPAFTNASGYFNPTPPAGGDPTLIEMIYNDCSFQAGPDRNTKMRHIGAGGGGGGEVNLEVNRCIFSTDRDRYDMSLDPADPNADTINFQSQQAGMSPATGGTTTFVNDSVFLDGLERQFGSDPATTTTGIFINRCIMEPTSVGFSLEPDPGSVNSFFLINTVMRWDSRLKGDGDGQFDVAIRGEATGGDRGINFNHCLLQDVAGVDGVPNVNMMNLDTFSGFTGGITSLTNCIVDAPAMAEGLFSNIDEPGLPPLNTDNPAGEGNLFNTGTLALQLFPESGILTRGDPQLGAGDGGPAGAVAAGSHDAEANVAYHLTRCSLHAIDQVNGDAGLDVDIDGDARPQGASFDIGPDEFVGTPGTPEDCVVLPTGACCTDGVCDVQTQPDCEAGGGTYQGDGIACGVDTCPVGTPFRRGDHDGSGLVDITDPLNLLGFLFLGQTPPICEDASDGDNSAALDISDALNVLGFLFLGSFPLDATIPSSSVCGVDQAEAFDPDGAGGFPEQPGASLGCETYPSAVGTACP